MSKYKIHPQAIEDAPAPIVKKISKIYHKDETKPMGSGIVVEISHPWLDTIDGAEICLFKSTKSTKKFYVDGHRKHSKSSRKFRFRKVLSAKVYNYDEFLSELESLYSDTASYKNCHASIAIRYPNPEFFELVDSNKELHDSTTMFKIGLLKIPRYIISKHTILKVCADNENGCTGVGIRNICIQ